MTSSRQTTHLNLPSFRDKFNENYVIGAEETRCRKFNPQNLFLTVLRLISGKNDEGYFHALARTWSIISNLTKAPRKSALSQIRKRISFEFFKEHSDKIIEAYEPFRRTWRGLHIYATDGDQYELPRSGDILEYIVSVARQIFLHGHLTSLIRFRI